MQITESHIGEGKLLELDLNSFELNNHLDALTEIEWIVYIGFQHEKRRREFVATRILRNHLFGKETLTYSETGAPQSPKNGFLSISHTSEAAALFYHPFYPVGLDLEEIAPKAKRVALKFLHEDEYQEFDLSSEKEMVTCWSAKETLYKLAGRNGIDFKKELRLSKENDTLYIGRIFQGEFWEECKITIFEKNNRIYTFNSTPLERK